MATALRAIGSSWTARKNLHASFPSLKVLKPPTASILGDGHLMELFAFRYCAQAAENFCVAWEAHGKALVGHLSI
jgi:hypothetical protein